MLTEEIISTLSFMELTTFTDYLYCAFFEGVTIESHDFETAEVKLVYESNRWAQESNFIKDSEVFKLVNSRNL